jgi:hypothetical protein
MHILYIDEFILSSMFCLFTNNVHQNITMFPITMSLSKNYILSSISPFWFVTIVISSSIDS